MKWIRTKDQTPEPYHKILVYDPYVGIPTPRDIDIGWFADGEFYSWKDDEILGDIEYWMPLPEVP